MRKVTIVDIAHELDVSPSTVSRALNGIGRMNEETRQQILGLAKKWGYHPNPHAQRLKNVKTSTIGLIVPELTHHFYSRIIKGVDSVLDEFGYQQIICVSNEEHEKERTAAHTLLNARVDGLLVALSNETNDFDHLQELVNEEIPIVFLDRMCEDIDAPYVMTDDFEGARIATDFLVGNGCEKIAFLIGPENLSTSFSRLMGYKEALKKRSIEFDEKLVILSGLGNSADAQLIELLEHYHIDGVFAHSDYHSFKAMEILLKNGFKIPGDVQVIGYADEPLASYTTPKITTIKQPAFEIGRVGMELLLQEIESGTKGEPKILDTKSVIRDSTR
jgi:DNA-binding LacI/PurR family transcriptional regulator